MADNQSSKRGAIIAAVALVAVLAAAWAGYSAVSGVATAGEATGQSAQADTQAASASAEAGAGTADAAAERHWNNPALSSLTMADSEGYDITLGTLCDGKPTVVNVWATWCRYCVDEMQDYQELYEKYGNAVQFVMLDSSETADEIEAAHAYVEDRNFTFPVFYDFDHELQDYFGVSAYPTTVVISAEGEILSNRPGRIVTETYDQALAELAG